MPSRIVINPHSRQVQGRTPRPLGGGLNGATAPQVRVPTISNPLSRAPSLPLQAVVKKRVA